MKINRRGDASLTHPVENLQPDKTEMDGSSSSSAAAGATPGEQKTQMATRRRHAALIPCFQDPQPRKKKRAVIFDSSFSAAAGSSSPRAPSSSTAGDEKTQSGTRHHSKITHRFHTPPGPFSGHLHLKGYERWNCLDEVDIVCPWKGVVSNLPVQYVGQSGSKLRQPCKTKMAIVFDSSSPTPGDQNAALNPPSEDPQPPKTEEARIEGKLSSYAAGASSSKSAAELPLDIWQEILSRSTVEMAARSRCVSTLLRSLASSAHFSVLQHQRDTSPPSLLIHTYTCEGHIVYAYGPRDPQPNLVQIHEFPRSQIPGFHHLYFVGSINGLFLVVGLDDGTEMYLWNPCTGFSLHIPPPHLEFSAKIHNQPRVGLGLVPGGNVGRDYFIVRLVPRKDDLPDAVEMFSLGTGMWETLDNPKKTFIMAHCSADVASGVPYWLGHRSIDNLDYVLVWFNFTDRSFYVEDLPFPTDDVIGLAADNNFMRAMLEGEGEEHQHPHNGLWMRVRAGMAGWGRTHSPVVVGDHDLDVGGFYHYQGDTLIVSEDRPGNNLTLYGVDGAGILEIRQVVHIEIPIPEDREMYIYVWRKSLIEVQ